MFHSNLKVNKNLTKGFPKYYREILCLDKFDSKELYNIQLLANFLKPASQAYFENIFAGHVFEWDNICILPRIVTIDSRIRIFEYKILHNVIRI